MDTGTLCHSSKRSPTCHPQVHCGVSQRSPRALAGSQWSSLPTQDFWVVPYPAALCPPSPATSRRGFPFAFSAQLLSVMVHLTVNPACNYPSLHIPLILHSKLEPPYLHIPPSPFQIFTLASEHETMVISPRPSRLRTNKVCRYPCAGRNSDERSESTLQPIRCSENPGHCCFSFAALGAVQRLREVSIMRVPGVSWARWKQGNSSFLPSPGDKFCLGLNLATGDKYIYAHEKKAAIDLLYGRQFPFISTTRNGTQSMSRCKKEINMEL